MNMNTFFTWLLIWILLDLIIILIRDSIHVYSLDRFARLWFSDEDRVKFYNQFIEYLTTDIETGLYKPLEFPVPRIYSINDYLNLQGEDRNAALAVMKMFQEQLRKDPKLADLKSIVLEYLEAAAENKKLKGF